MVQGRSEKKKQNADKRELKLLIETTARKGVAIARKRQKRASTTRRSGGGADDKRTISSEVGGMRDTFAARALEFVGLLFSLFATPVGWSSSKRGPS